VDCGLQENDVSNPQFTIRYEGIITPMTFVLPPIYPITDKELARRTTHLSILRELVRGGATLVQIRDKSTPIHELLRDLRQCVDFARAKHVMLIINDRCDLALSCGAMGVHLGQEDLPPAAARSILGPKRIIGLSTHSTADVRESSGLPIQYIGLGPVYETSTKKDALPTVGLKRLARACASSLKPVVAIGGIGLEQITEVLNAGAASAAVISALMKAKDLAREMERFLEKSIRR
jgi:thiamine-phosphate pyrophosphorylase